MQIQAVNGKRRESCLAYLEYFQNTFCAGHHFSVDLEGFGRRDNVAGLDKAARLGRLAKAANAAKPPKHLGQSLL